MSSTIFKLVFSIFLFSGQASAEKYETVVEGVAFNSASKVVLDQDAIKKSKAPDIATLLSTQANISVSNSNFQPGSIYLRGGDSSHVLILVDGMPVFDASTVQKTSSLNSIDIKSVRKIEIIKGSQSVLYGGQALTGVIKIETLPLEIESRAAGNLELGAYEFQKAGLSGVRQIDNTQGVIANAEWFYKNARSPVLDSEYRYPSRLSAGQVGYLYRDQFDSFIKVSGFNQLDNITTTGNNQKAVDVSDFKASNQTIAVAAGLKAKNIKMRPQVLVGTQNTTRFYKEIATNTDEAYGSRLLHVRGEVTPIDLEQLRAVAGVNYSTEFFDYSSRTSGKYNASTEKKGVFAKADYSLTKDLLLEAGIRGDYEMGRDREDTFQIGLTAFENLKAEYSTGYKAPSLFQMFSVGYGGNPNLKAEKARSYSVSYEQPWESEQFSQLGSVTGFVTSFENLIQYVGAPPTGGYQNIGKAETRGVELAYAIKNKSGTRLDTNVGYQEPWDLTNSMRLIRRPLQSGSVRLSQNLDKDQFGIETLWNGDRVDRFGSGSYGTLKGYNYSNGFYNHQVTDQISGYIRVNNIENVRFESSRGFYDEGRFWLLGMEMQNL